MLGTLALAKTEIFRLLRNKLYMIFSVVMPVAFYLVFAKRHAEGYHVSFAAFYMIGMAAVGAFSGALNANAMRVAEERSVGWIRQVRLTPLPAGAYVIAKVLASMATTVPPILMVFLLGRLYGGVEMAAWKWLVCAVVVWSGTLIFAALAIALGYKLEPKSVQPIVIVLNGFFSIVGGLWFPLGGVLKNVGEFTPTYQIVRISTDVISGANVVPWYVVGLVGWFAIFVVLATWAVRGTAETI